MPLAVDLDHLKFRNNPASISVRSIPTDFVDLRTFKKSANGVCASVNCVKRAPILASSFALGEDSPVLGRIFSSDSSAFSEILFLALTAHMSAALLRSGCGRANAVLNSESSSGILAS